MWPETGLSIVAAFVSIFLCVFFFEFFCLFFPSNVLSWGLGAGCKGLTIRRRSQGFGARVLGLRTSGLRRSKPEGLGFVFLRSQDLGRSRPL